MLFISTKHKMLIFRVIPFIKLQNNTSDQFVFLDEHTMPMKDSQLPIIQAPSANQNITNIFHITSLKMAATLVSHTEA